ncbi:MAG: hypothetical protein CR967_04620 [Proteobacteria bacterium]|nr:MAG: hypothetical protein CR967_04620 [Pseudomonadota bacterium]
MIASDFIDETKLLLQQKSKHWHGRELFIHLSRAYNLLQFDLPYFSYKEDIGVLKGDDSFYLLFKPLENISLQLNGIKCKYSNIENLYNHKDSRYCFEGEKVLLNFKAKTDCSVLICYKYARELKNKGCTFDLPPQYLEALRLLFLSFIYEKPILNTKERNLSSYYKKQYLVTINNIPKNTRNMAKNIKSKYQRI